MGWAVLLSAAGAAAVFAPDPPAEPAAILADAGRPAKTAATSRAHAGLLESLPARETIGPSRGELFSARSWAPPPAPVAAVSRPPVNPSPSAPPMPYRVAGEVVHDGARHLVLARGDTVHIVREGASLEGGYRVESIRSDRVTLLYEPLGTRAYLAMPGADTPPVQAASAATAGNTAAPAQLRWEGPERVHAGRTFDVALKLTSGEPLRASPLQLNFDAALLEPIEVRAGRYFSDGSFSYRVNPAGSIFIGASGKGSAAADAELLVVSFKPIRTGATELQLSSVLLQGAAGRAIAHAQPAAFRTAIIQ